MSIKCAMSAALVAAALLGPTSTPASAQVPPDLQNPQVDIVYLEPRDPAFRPIADRVKQRRVLEQLKVFLAPLKMPRKLTVNVDECGAPSRAYRAQGPVTICYELVDQIEKVAAKAEPNERERVLVSAFVQVAFHGEAVPPYDAGLLQFCEPRGDFF